MVADIFTLCQQTARKSTGGGQQSELTLKSQILTFICFLGKAPRKQLATKAARKTAAAVRILIFVVVVGRVTC
jgi:hypothetical protein